ncbi:MAG: oligosaccharide flippase family protein [Desulfosoma sp.]
MLPQLQLDTRSRANHPGLNGFTKIGRELAAERNAWAGTSRKRIVKAASRADPTQRAEVSGFGAGSCPAICTKPFWGRSLSVPMQDQDKMLLTPILNQVKVLLPHGEFKRNFSLLAGSSAFAQIINVLAAPIITRIYSPSDYGVFGVFGSIAAMAMVVATFRFEWGIPNPESDDDAINLLVLCFMVMTAVAVFSVPLVKFFLRIFHKVDIISMTESYLWLLPLYILAGASYQALNVWALRKKNFKAIAKTRLSRSLSQTSLNIGLGICKWGPLGLLLGGLTGQAAGICTFGALLWKQDRDILLRVSTSDIKSSFSRYWKFAFLYTGVGVVNTANLQLTAILLTSLYQSTVAGCYLLAQSVIGIPMQLIGQAVTQIFWAESAKLVRSDPIGLKLLFFRTSRKLIGVSLFLTIGGIISPFAFRFVFGEQWTAAGYYALYLTPMVMAQFVATTVSHLSVHELPYWQLVWDGSRLILVVLIFLVAKMLNLSPDVYILLHSILSTCMYGILYLMNAYAISLNLKSRRLRA